MFSAEDKKVFKYFDGSAWVFGDPLHIYRVLQEQTGGELNRFIRESNAKRPCPCTMKETPPDPNVLCDLCGNDGHVDNTEVSGPARTAILAAVRVAFELKPFDKVTGEGATEEICDWAMDCYQAYMESKKKPAAS